MLNEKRFQILRRCHVRLWTWLADNPLSNKFMWPEWDFNGGTIDLPFQGGFTCKVALLRQMAIFPPGNREGLCDYCPISWAPGGIKRCYDNQSPYFKWQEAVRQKDKNNARFYALKIARKRWR